MTIFTTVDKSNKPISDILKNTQTLFISFTYITNSLNTLKDAIPSLT